MTTLPAVHVRHEDREGGVVAFVTLDNERLINVMNTALMEGFVAAFEESRGAGRIFGAVVLTGAGERAFSSAGRMWTRWPGSMGPTRPGPLSCASMPAAPPCATARFR